VDVGSTADISEVPNDIIFRDELILKMEAAYTPRMTPRLPASAQGKDPREESTSVMKYRENLKSVTFRVLLYRHSGFSRIYLLKYMLDGEAG
jgi:hypothetical protein